jgi:cytochrome c-type biogenesis protein CcmH
MAADQDGRRADAETIWREMLAKAPPGAPWVDLVRNALDRGQPGAPAASAPGPGAADVEAASKLAPDQQKEMITGMVSRLAARLKADGSDVEGWLRLLRAYAVLGDRDKAQAAAADARRALAGDPDKLRRIDEMVKELGLQG